MSEQMLMRTTKYNRSRETQGNNIALLLTIVSLCFVALVRSVLSTISVLFCQPSQCCSVNHLSVVLSTISVLLGKRTNEKS